ncbi:MAG: hypothetical protein ACJAVI_005826 [Candidatus Azotimanducaceae bacterium]|jgi:hypothetical protein
MLLIKLLGAGRRKRKRIIDPDYVDQTPNREAIAKNDLNGMEYP